MRERLEVMSNTAGAESAPAVGAEEVIKTIMDAPAELRQEQTELCDRYETLYLSCLGSGIRYDKDRVQTTPDQGDGRLADIADIERQIRVMPYRRQAAKATVEWLMDSAEMCEETQEIVLLRLAGRSIREIMRDVGMANPAQVHRELKFARRQMMAQLVAHLFVAEEG